MSNQPPTPPPPFPTLAGPILADSHKAELHGTMFAYDCRMRFL